MIQSLERAFLILETLDEAGPDGMGPQDLARKTGLKFPTAHNFLKSLIQLGYVDRHQDTGKYRLGPKAFSLGYKRDARKVLSEIAGPVAARLNRSLDDTVVVAFYSNRTWHTLFCYTSSMGMLSGPGLPVNKNLYISATGRCILCGLPEHELEGYVRERGLPGADWDGTGAFPELKAKLAAVKKRGFEIYDRHDGVVGAAFPVCSPSNGLHAAIGVHLASPRFSGEHKKAVVEGLREAAAAILAIYEN